ncbi:MAG: hypothetical protein GY869_01250, partial [Planctomycetes bacterium]|nr:hypothetical protein [Planctomycetota bacterium]
MLYNRKLFFLLLNLIVSVGYSQTNTRKPDIGYLYPAGGRQGSVVLVTAGGQFLNNPKSVHVSGEGVHATVVQYMKSFRNLNADQRRLLQESLEEVRDKRLAELPDQSKLNQAFRNINQARQRARQAATNTNARKKQEADKATVVSLPDHPLLYDLDNKSLRELA